MSSTCGGESTHSNTLSRSSSRRIPMDDPDGSTPWTNSMIGSFPQASTLRAWAGSHGSLEKHCNTLGVRLAFWHLHCMSLSVICSYMSMEHM
jgi:hypothetical protein